MKMIYALSIILLFFVFLFFCFLKAFYAPRQRTDPKTVSPNKQYQKFREQILALVENLCSYPYEQVYIKSYDGLDLAARYYQVRQGAPVMIMFHGYHSAACRDCSGIFKLAMELGWNMLLPDMRSHGLSQGRVICMGIKERRDCLDWVEYISQRLGKDTPVLLAGCSMGASTIMMSARQLPEQVKGLICDCGYSSVRAMIERMAVKLHLPVKLSYFMLRLSAMIYGGFDPDSCSPLSSLAESKVPVLIIHGEDDHLVPCSMARENYEASASDIKMLLTVPGAGHGMSFLADEEKYRETVHSFLKRLGLL